MSMDDATIFDQLHSPLRGALHHVMGVMKPVLNAQIVASRIFSNDPQTHTSIVDASQLDLPAGAHTALQDWPIQAESVFGLVDRKKLTDHVFRPRQLVDELTFARHRLYHPIEPFTQIIDSMAVTFPLSCSQWVMFVFLRTNRQPPFTQIQMTQLERLKPAMANTVRRCHNNLFQCDTPESKPDNANTPSQATSQISDLLAKLTRTERQVLELLRANITERKIADTMHRSPHTVHVHVKNIYRKLEIRSRKQLYALFPNVSSNS